MRRFFREFFCLHTWVTFYNVITGITDTRHCVKCKRTKNLCRDEWNGHPYWG